MQRPCYLPASRARRLAQPTAVYPEQIKAPRRVSVCYLMRRGHLNLPIDCRSENGQAVLPRDFSLGN
jgi:hypothetical protein